MIAQAVAAFALTVLGATPAPPVEDDPSQPSPLVAAVWCTESAEGAPGCDSGMGFALQRWGRLSAVAAIGTETLGAGIAWTVHRTDRGRALAVALGAVARYDLESGVDLDETWLSLGCTMSLRGGQ